MWLDVFKWPEMIKYKKERDDQFAGTEGRFEPKSVFGTVVPDGHDEALCHILWHIDYMI